jgi:hypothetical protein
MVQCFLLRSGVLGFRAHFGSITIAVARRAQVSIPEIRTTEAREITAVKESGKRLFRDA